MTTESKPPARPKPATERGYATRLERPRTQRPAAEVDDDALTTIQGALPTEVDPKAPPSGDPHARVAPHRQVRGGPVDPRAVIAKVPEPPRIPVAGAGARSAARFDPHGRIDDSSRTAKWDPGAPPPAPAAPHAVARADSEPMRMVSMKTPLDAEADKPLRELPVVKLRALSNVHQTPPGGLGRLAPPLDPRAARPQPWRDYVIWGSLAVVVACVVTLVIWFVAR